MNFMQNFLSHVFPKYRDKLYSRYIRGDTPVYSDFGNNIYVSDIVRHALRAIAVETSKISLKSVIDVSVPHTISVQEDSITRLFKYKPNPLMTSQEFFYKIAWLRKVNLNAFIYPQYKIVKGKKVYTAFYPLSPKVVTFSYCDDEIYITMQYENGTEYTLPYKDIIHLRDEYTLNQFIGGDINGQPDNREVLNTVSILDKVMQGMPKAITASLEMKGIYKVKSQIDRDKLNAERSAFENDINTSTAGIVAFGYDGDFTPININPQLIPKDVIEWLETKILKNYGVSMAIVSGDFTEGQSSAFYQKCIEDFIIQAEQAFTACLFTSEQQEEGHKVKIYDRFVQHLSMETKLKMLQFAAPMGAFGKDEVRELLGYEPMGNNTVMQSLNWIDATIAPDYQLKRQTGQNNATASNTANLNSNQQSAIIEGAEDVVGEKLNGAQISSLISVIQSVSAGTISRESALAILTTTLGINQANAERILGTAKI